MTGHPHSPQASRRGQLARLLATRLLDTTPILASTPPSDAGTVLAATALLHARLSSTDPHPDSGG